MDKKPIGPSFYDELAAAGLAGAPFAWSASGEFLFDEAMTEAQRDLVKQVYEAHDPSREAWSTYRQRATDQLSATNQIVMEYFERGDVLPAEWLAYRQALRAIANAEAGDVSIPFPVMPA